VCVAGAAFVGVLREVLLQEVFQQRAQPDRRAEGWGGEGGGEERRQEATAFCSLHVPRREQQSAKLASGNPRAVPVAWNRVAPRTGHGFSVP